MTALYQSDRADRATTLTVSLATMGAAVTYVVGTVAFYDKLDLLGWAIALLPFPMICIAAFHSLLVNLTGIRARSILHLEQALLDNVETDTPRAPATSLDRTRIGVTATEVGTNLHTAPMPQRITILIAYGGVGVVYLGYITLMLWRSARHLSGWVTVPAVLYAALLFPIALSWRYSVMALDLRDLSLGSRAGRGR
ncbi:hypothetical protein [Saccharothrix sp. NRRL B-16348]|uniref:hypothetical protein n=1 Tax=Saccharothrix sp. NRRL B-16348 TaxID=1415542 RepID=UPI0012F9D507|nr:hypothetical protein [Saccharothrix sp. NRRL B-16348]